MSLPHYRPNPCSPRLPEPLRVPPPLQQALRLAGPQADGDLPEVLCSEVQF